MYIIIIIINICDFYILQDDRWFLQVYEQGN